MWVSPAPLVNVEGSESGALHQEQYVLQWQAYSVSYSAHCFSSAEVRPRPVLDCRGLLPLSEVFFRNNMMPVSYNWCLWLALAECRKPKGKSSKAPCLELSEGKIRLRGAAPLFSLPNCWKACGRSLQTPPAYDNEGWGLRLDALPWLEQIREEMKK